jgi:enoyl-CoA hydratase/carnithine racemase
MDRENGAHVDESDSAFKVLCSDDDRVRLLTLHRPRKLNAFTAVGYTVLKDALDAAAADPDIAVCVVTGSGRAFSSGVDLAEMGRPGGSAELGVHFDPLLETLAGVPKPLLAAVNGMAVGFGATLLLHCDVVVVDEAAEIRMPFIALGTSAEAASSWLLPLRVGSQQAAWMVLSGASLSADSAVACGFAIAKASTGRVVDDAMQRARQMAVHAVPALVANKQLLRAGVVEHVGAAWEREKATMARLAHELGPFGWSQGE